MSAQTALIIDDEPDIRELVSITISRLGLECHTAANLSDARNVLENYPVDICLTDMRLPDGNGVDFVSYMQERYPDIPVAVITAHGNMDAAVTAMKNGAFDFVSKPVDLKLLRKLIESSAKTSSKVKAEQKPTCTTPVKAKPGNNTPGNRLLGNSAPMQELKGMIVKLSRSQAPVVISGESGTGKELVARLIHESGPRADKPFIPVNCGAIPSELMESEFFGHKKGSFTGATEDKIGLFQAAEDGTLFLDEVAELPLFMQVKLLRVIQEKAVKPVGENREIPINVRILSASYKDLVKEVEESRFRHDLYYRLNVIGIRVPPLRDRPEDIPELATSILQKIAEETGQAEAFPISEEAMEKLRKHPFKGNVRELENILERAVTLADGDCLLRADLMLPTPSETNENETKPEILSETSLKELETEKILEALDKTQWNRKQAAKKLGLSYRQLRYRLQKIHPDSD
ncbi:MAG: sigma-54-dependent Fis family transcriptional regulator [Gammaproteobacteria bacterium]|nr:sigma-54-dependent Fis family transcriptional regulator [Gammaproteobacteria bacterium]